MIAAPPTGVDLVEAARVAVVPCAAVALLALLASTFLPTRPRQVLAATAVVLGFFAVAAYAFYLLNSA